MDPAIAATLIGIMVSALLGVFATAFHLLRSDIRDTNKRIDRLDAKLDGLLLALARAGLLVDPQVPQPPQPPSGTLGGSGLEG